MRVPLKRGRFCGAFHKNRSIKKPNGFVRKFRDFEENPINKKAERFVRLFLYQFFVFFVQLVKLGMQGVKPRALLREQLVVRRHLGAGDLLRQRRRLRLECGNFFFRLPDLLFFLRFLRPLRLGTVGCRARLRPRLFLDRLCRLLRLFARRLLGGGVFVAFSRAAFLAAVYSSYFSANVFTFLASISMILSAKFWIK